jgi:hypothetical protein
LSIESNRASPLGSSRWWSAKSAPGFVRELNPIKGLVTVTGAPTGAHLPTVTGGIGHCVAGAVVRERPYAWLEWNLHDLNLVIGVQFGTIAALLPHFGYDN